MSVSISQVISAGGYDLDSVEHAQWLLRQQDEWEQLIESAEALVEAQDE